MQKFTKYFVYSLILLVVALSIFVGTFFFGDGLLSVNGHGLSQAEGSSNWRHLSSTKGDLEPPSSSSEQTASLILDIDQDGISDFVIGIRKAPGPSLVWYRSHSDGWSKYLIDETPLDIEAGGAYADIDGDGDLDIVMGVDYQSNKVWWWENPNPNFDPNTSWTRREIKNSGENKHHDQIFGDFDGDGEVELVFWNQGAQTLFLADIPADPKTPQSWLYTPIYTWSGGDEHEGLAQADIDGDGKVDLIGGGRWFKHNGGANFTPNVIDDDQRFSRAAAGQLIPGGRPEIVFVVGDGVGKARWYEWDGNAWIGKDLLNSEVDHGHSLEIADLNGDGRLDIFLAEMRLNGRNSDAKMWIFLGDGRGNFTQTKITSGFGNHESKLGDLDGDGDLDVLGKPYNWETPRIDIWLNEPSKLGDQWQRNVLDAERPWTAIFITAADLDGDGYKDVIAGGWWYKNPGNPGGSWERNDIGTPLNNMAAVYDFDGDGDVDILGTGGTGADSNSNFFWARNDGQGGFTILDNIQPGDGDFLQGVAVGQFNGQSLEVALSWHAGGKGVQMLMVPSNPTVETWTWKRISDVSQDEGLSAGDIDGDGDLDLLLGTQWLRNDNGELWTPVTLNNSGGMPDRNRLADINADGKLDAVVGFEAISQLGKLAWYEQGSSPEDLWLEHLIADPSMIGPMSLDVADMDGDGDLDVVAGEHHTEKPDQAALYIFENMDGKGMDWRRHVVYIGDEHHDGAQIVDIDEDGDMDILSIGWTHSRVLLYENQGGGSQSGEHSSYLPSVTSNFSSESDKITPTPPASEVSCLDVGPKALYTFVEGSGSTVKDRSGSIPQLDLILPANGVQWLPDGGVAVTSAAMIESSEPAAQLIEAIKAAGEITVEGWIKPENLTQDGPARILTISKDSLNRNFTLGQGLWGGQPSDVFDVRLRTTGTDLNGQPSLTTPEGSAQLALTHLVYSRNSEGESRIYLNGEEAASASIEGDFSNWNSSYKLVLANETSGDRPWLGEIHRVAIYNCALTAEAVAEKFIEGPRAVAEIQTPTPTKEASQSSTPSASSDEATNAKDPVAAPTISTSEAAELIGRTISTSSNEFPPLLLLTGLLALIGVVLSGVIYITRKS